MTVHDDLAVCYCMTSLQGLYHDNEDRCSVAKFDGWSVNAANSVLRLPIYQPVEAKANLDVDAPTPKCDDQLQCLIRGSAKTWCAQAEVSLSKGNSVEEIRRVGGLSEGIVFSIQCSQFATDTTAPRRLIWWSRSYPKR